MVQCILCNEEIPSSRRTNAKYCSKECGNLFRGRAYYGNNPEKVMAKRLRENGNISRRILYRVKSRAKRLKIPFNIDETDIVVPEYCPVLRLKIRE